jgi:hypothetical protein
VSGPAEIRSLAVTGEDLVAAVETNRTTAREAVLRVTPPFSGRMRARLHVVHGETAASPRPLHVDPERLLGPDTPAYPRPADTGDELRTDSAETYTVDRHREYHAERVETWRGRLRETVRDRATIGTPAGPTEVDVHLLG